MERVLFAPLTKVVDQPDGTLEVWGRAAAEEPDPKGEVFDYEASKPFIKNWSDQIFAASGGKSLGNLRAMHNPKIAAGKLIKLDFNDAAKAVDVVAQVVDAEEVKKTRAGVYTGFSLGGSYGPKRQEGNLVYYAAIPSELSLADNPMIKSARITLVKVDGSEEELPLKKRIHHVGRMAELLYSFRCLAGDIFYEAEQEKDGSLVPGKLTDALVNLVEVFREFAAEEAQELVADIRQFLAAPAGPVGNQMAMVMTVPKGWGLGEIEEFRKNWEENSLAEKGKWVPLIKAGALHTAGEMAQIQTIHDHAVALGAACQGGMEKMADPTLKDVLAKVEDLAGQISSLSEQLTKVQTDHTAQGEALAKVEAENTELKDRLAKVEAQPAALKGSLKAVDKGDDVTPLAKTDGPNEEEMIKNQDTLGLIKAAQSKPISV